MTTRRLPTRSLPDIPSPALIAKVTGMTRQHVNRALKGENGLTLESAAKIAKAAKITLDQLWGHINWMKTEKGEKVA